MKKIILGVLSFVFLSIGIILFFGESDELWIFVLSKFIGVILLYVGYKLLTIKE